MHMSTLFHAIKFFDSDSFNDYIIILSLYKNEYTQTQKRSLFMHPLYSYRMYVYIPTYRDKIRVKHLLLQQHECFDAIGCCSSYPTMLHVNKKKIIWHSKRIYDAYAL